MKAIVLAAALFEDGVASVIARSDNAILFGVCQAMNEAVLASWFRVIFKNGSNRAVALTSWKVGHEDAPLALPAFDQLLSGPTPDFIVPGDYFEVDLETIDTNRRKTVRMSQEAFDLLMRGLLSDDH